MGVGLTLVGLRPWVLLVLIAITVTHLALPVAASSSQALWQAKVPPEIQGRVFAVRQMFAIGATPLAFVLAGFLAERVFEPMFAAGRPWRGLSWIAGTGDGRGIGLLLVIMGVSVTVVAFVSWRSHAIQNLDHEVPDISARANENAGT